MLTGMTMTGVRAAFAVLLAALYGCRDGDPRAREEIGTVRAHAAKKRSIVPLHTATMTVHVREHKTRGGPDISACIKADGERRCYPGGARGISAPACTNSYDCNLDVAIPRAGTFEVEIWDADPSARELISKGQCSIGAACRFGPATVQVTTLAIR